MSVVITLLVALAVFWIFGPTDFAINMTVLVAVFAIIEGINVLLDKKTITQKFRAWAETQPRWKVWLITGVLAAGGVFFMLHLAIGI